jgi:hypothetical protein
MLGQVISRATREQRDRCKPGGQVAEQFNRSGQRPCLVWIIDNWRERAIEIETHGRYVRHCCQSGSVLSQHRLTCGRPGQRRA